MSIAMSGENNPGFGIPLPDERKEKISRAHMGKKLTEEHIDSISKGIRRSKDVGKNREGEPVNGPADNRQSG